MNGYDRCCIGRTKSGFRCVTMVRKPAIACRRHTRQEPVPGRLTKLRYDILEVFRQRGIEEIFVFGNLALMRVSPGASRARILDIIDIHRFTVLFVFGRDIPNEELYAFTYFRRN